LSRQTFKRMSFAERGHFPNAIRIWPVTEIRTEQEGIALTRRGQQRRYKWSDIKRAHIRNEEIYKGYGAYASAKMIRRTLLIETVDGSKYEFDVSGNFAAFKETPQLLAILNEHLTITTSPVKRFNHALWISLIAAALVLWIILRGAGL
jgi:hypothetical protein